MLRGDCGTWSYDAVEHNINFILKREVRNVLMENIDSLLQKRAAEVLADPEIMLVLDDDDQLYFHLSKAFSLNKIRLFFFKEI